MSIFYWIILLLCVFVPLWMKSHVFRYYAKLGYYYSMYVLVATLCIPIIAITSPKDVRNMRPIGWVWLKLFSVFGITYDVRNEKYMQSDKPYVLVSNHQSSLDVIGMMYSLPDRCTAMAKQELFYTGTFGLAAWLCGIVFIQRHDKKKAISTMDSTAKHIHENNIKLWIFPEGTRSSDGAFLPFKKGAFHLAVQAQIPIVPVVFSSYKNFYDKKRKIFESGKVIINALPPVPTEGLGPDDVTDLTERVRNLMIPAYEEVSEEVMKTSPPLESRI